MTSLFSKIELISQPIWSENSAPECVKATKKYTWKPYPKPLKMALIYFGSKNMIAHKLLAEIHKESPNAKYFFDIFGGGGAMAIHAKASGLLTHYNELKTDLVLMFEYINDCIKNPRNEWGIFDKEVYFWVNKAEFDLIKDRHLQGEHLSGVEIIKSFIYSFGGAGVNSAYGFGKRQWKEAGHNLIFYPFLKADFERQGKGLEWCVETLAKEFNKHYADLSEVESELPKRLFREFALNDFGTWIDRRALYAKFVIRLEALCIARFQKDFKDISVGDLAKYSTATLCDEISVYRQDLVKTAKKYKQIRRGEYITNFNDVRGLVGCQRLESLQQLERLERLDQLQQLERLQQLESLQRLEKLAYLFDKITNKSFIEFTPEFFENFCKERGLDKSEIIIYCFDSKTEIFTNNGWKFINEVDINNDLFLSQNPQNAELEFVKANAFIKKHYKGKMLEYKGKSVNFCVTPEHKIFYDKKGKMEFTRAEDFANMKGVNFITAGGIWQGKNEKTFNLCGYSVDFEKFAYLLGIFITDGSVNNQGGCIISQKKAKIKDKITKILNELSLDFTFYEKTGTFYLSRKYNAFFTQFYQKEKRRIPKIFKEASVGVLKSLLNGIIDGDGTRGLHKTEIYLCKNQGLINDICEVIYKCGFGSRVFDRMPKESYLKSENRIIKGKKPYAVIRIHTRARRLKIDKNQSWCDYNGNVFCVTLEKWHSVLTRREGGEVWLGQCDPPYLRTDKLNGDYGYHSGFDRQGFVNWCKDLSQRGFSVFISESDGFAEFSGFKAIWQGTKASSQSKAQNPDKPIMNELLFKP